MSCLCADPNATLCAEKWCACCYSCCMDEQSKVMAVMKHFAAEPVSRARVGVLQRLVGRCVLAGTQEQALYAPSTGKPCVYYHIKVEEQHEEQVYVTDTDQDGNACGGHYETTYTWVPIFEEEHGQDFYIQDGAAKLVRI